MKITIKKIDYTGSSITAQVKFTFEDGEGVKTVLSDFTWQETVQFETADITIKDLVERAKEQFQERLRLVSGNLGESWPEK